MSEQGWRSIAGEDFDARAAVGGVRGMVEAAAPGIVFVVAYLVWGGFKIPTIAAVAAVVIAVVVRLAQRTPIQHALGGVFGVVIGAVWAWRAGEPGEFYVPGFLINAGTLIALVASILLRWPIVGLVVAVARGASPTAWRQEPALVRVFSLGTWIMAALFALKLAVQVPLYFADQVAALGIAKLAMGIPLFVLTAWIVWSLVGSAELPLADEDRPQQKR